MLVQVKRITIFLKRIFYLLYLNKKLQATFVPYIDKSICEKVTVILVMGHFVPALPKEVLIHAKEITGEQDARNQISMVYVPILQH